MKESTRKLLRDKVEEAFERYLENFDIDHMLDGYVEDWFYSNEDTVNDKICEYFVDEINDEIESIFENM